jgi:hypothetical protein
VMYIVRVIAKNLMRRKFCFKITQPSVLRAENQSVIQYSGPLLVMIVR